MRWLVVSIALISLVSVASADITFDGLGGPVANGTTFTDASTGVMATFSWGGGALGIENLAPFGAASFGTGSLSVFGAANFVEVSLIIPAGFVLTTVSFDIGDFGGDLDELRVTTLAPDEFPADITKVALTTDQLMDSPTPEGPFGFGFQSFSFERALGIGDFMGSPALSFRAGSPGFPNSAFFDNLGFTLVPVGAFQAGTDDPESGFGGGGGGGETGTGDGGLPSIPEPGVLALLAAGGALLALRRRR